jgi:hypothetical protein
VATDLFLLEPTNNSLKNTLPASKAFVAKAGRTSYHLQMAALLPWYTGAFDGSGNIYSFPGSHAFAEHSAPCPAPTRQFLAQTRSPR